MAELHEALKYLSPASWSDVPVDNLSHYLPEHFAAGELICNSVPPPANGEPFHSARPHHKTPNPAKSAKEMHASEARPPAPHEDHQNLQRSWGKPLKFNPKDNPMNVAVYKMAGHDRHGAWFARRSVHEGLGFDKFQKAMAREFPHSLSVQGGPGAGAVRGLACDRRIERHDIEGKGRLEVYQLSAQFPGPVTPRDFMTMLITTETGLSHKSGVEPEDSSTHVPRSYMIVSRPIEHPDAPQRSGYVRGQYESVELIREVPLNRPSADGKSSEDQELNPVEWIMITRSDPGGGIPRFLVDRGTPEAMLGDLNKFLDWACAMDEVPDPDEDLDKQQETSEQITEAHQTNGASIPNGQATSAHEPLEEQKSVPESSQQQGGLLTSMASTITAGLDAYAPVAVSQQVHHYLEPEQPDHHLDESETSSVASSSDSFMSAEEMRRMSIAPANAGSNENLSIASGASGTSLPNKGDKKHLNSHEKEVNKLIQQREKLDRKLAKKRAEEENKLKKTQEKEQSEQEKAKEKMDKEMRKTEEKHRKELSKLEAKREKEARKAEEKRRKKDDQHKLSLVSRERDEFRSQLDIYKRESELLAERVEELQRENTLLANRLGKIGGPDVLKSLQDEMHEVGRKRAVSTRSEESKKSMESSTSKKSSLEKVAA